VYYRQKEDIRGGMNFNWWWI